ncbi:hypothetical protein ACOMHN_008922 [Nucella lapillus]
MANSRDKSDNDKEDQGERDDVYYTKDMTEFPSPNEKEEQIKKFLTNSEGNALIGASTQSNSLSSSRRDVRDEDEGAGAAMNDLDECAAALNLSPGDTTTHKSYEPHDYANKRTNSPVEREVTQEGKGTQNGTAALNNETFAKGGRHGPSLLPKSPNDKSRSTQLEGAASLGTLKRQTPTPEDWKSRSDEQPNVQKFGKVTKQRKGRERRDKPYGRDMIAAAKGEPSTHATDTSSTDATDTSSTDETDTSWTDETDTPLTHATDTSSTHGTDTPLTQAAGTPLTHAADTLLTVESALSSARDRQRGITSTENAQSLQPEPGSLVPFSGTAASRASTDRYSVDSLTALTLPSLPELQSSPSVDTADSIPSTLENDPSVRRSFSDQVSPQRQYFSGPLLRSNIRLHMGNAIDDDQLPNVGRVANLREQRMEMADSRDLPESSEAAPQEINMAGYLELLEDDQDSEALPALGTSVSLTVGDVLPTHCSRAGLHTCCDLSCWDHGPQQQEGKWAWEAPKSLGDQ